MTKKTNTVSLVLQIIVAGILVYPAYMKLSSHPDEVDLFTSLKMEPLGRYLVGFAEMAAVILVLIPGTVVAGALLAACIMTAAILGHVFSFGFAGALGMFAMLAFVCLGASLGILYLRRENIPGLR
ncbi:DoxX family protein [Roseibacillus ishigakijimensis]|uniref:DoxX family protein n=1 Tax=Roseibacillus ishigakijimensis TaxID=454146 RepID=A0A934VJF6_9BACT|nr:DoxX family protein [Roseibacillus ishigakijimensis]MBK1832549.1 DoxX family protein [Roseibacillus ishigakijimensis]